MIESQRILGTGILLKLSSMKVASPHLVDNNKPPSGWIANDKMILGSGNDIIEMFKDYSEYFDWPYNFKVLFELRGLWGYGY